LITVSLTHAREFLCMMNEGHPEYGCFISKEKTMTNFDYGHHVLNVTNPHQQCKRAHPVHLRVFLKLS
ncbi:uncharacterized protein BT62DRAFT_899516, partial [Guyanagaster necrorhizus]